MFNWYRISMCFTCFSCQFVFNKRFLKIYCLSVHSFFLVSFTSMYTTLKNISRKFLGVSLIWTFFSHVGAIFFLNSPYQSWPVFLSTSWSQFEIFKSVTKEECNIMMLKKLETIKYIHFLLINVHNSRMTLVKNLKIKLPVQNVGKYIINLRPILFTI